MLSDGLCEAAKFGVEAPTVSQHIDYLYLLVALHREMKTAQILIPTILDAEARKPSIRHISLRFATRAKQLDEADPYNERILHIINCLM